jgi:transcriptional regulator with XRE-family HTH domain
MPPALHPALGVVKDYNVMVKFFSDKEVGMRIEELVGRNVRAAREERGMTGLALGREMGRWLKRPWPRQTVSAIETGKRACAAEDLLALGLVLDKPMGYFFRPRGEDVVDMPSGESIEAAQIARLFREDAKAALEAIWEEVDAAKAAHAALGEHLMGVEAVLLVASGAKRTEVELYEQPKK